MSTALRTRRPTYTLLVAGATLALALMAAYRIGQKQLWIDEGVAVGLSNESLGRFLFVVTHWEVNQSPFYVVFRVWHVLGDDPAEMRALSAVFSVATVPLLYVLGRRLYNARVGAIASVVLAFNAFVLQWSQQVRAYTMAMFLVTLATYLFVRTVDEPTTVRGLGYGLVAVLAIATHFFSGFVIAAHAVSWLVLRPRPTRAFYAAGALLAACLAPVVVFVATAENNPLDWVDDPGGSAMARTLSRLAGGRLPLVAYIVLGTVGVFATFRDVRAEPRSPAAFRRLLPVSWVAVPLAVAIVFSVVVTPVFVDKFLIGIVPGAALLVAVGVVNLRPRVLRVAALVAIVALSLFGTARWYRTDSREDWIAATGALAAQLGPGDAVVVPSTASSVAEYYAHRAHGLDVTMDVPDADERPVADRLWELQGNVESEWSTVRDYMDWRNRNYELVETETFKEVALLRYERRDI